MNLLISPLSQTPIYEQIREQIRELALTGSLKPGEQLPSIRVMAKELQVGVITVKRAYEELENDGIIVNLQGRGCFVKEIDTAAAKEIHLRLLRGRLCELRQFCDMSGIKRDEIIEEIDRLYGGNGNESGT